MEFCGILYAICSCRGQGCSLAIKRSNGKSHIFSRLSQLETYTIYIYIVSVVEFPACHVWWHRRVFVKAMVQQYGAQLLCLVYKPHYNYKNFSSINNYSYIMKQRYLRYERTNRNGDVEPGATVGVEPWRWTALRLHQRRSRWKAPGATLHRRWVPRPRWL